MPIGPATIHEFLMTHGISYKAEHRFREHSEVARMPFDFFLPKHRLLIEYHGRQHAEGWSRNAESREEIQRRDAIKERWAATSGYDLVSVLAWRTKTRQAIRQFLAKTLGVSPELPRPLTPKEQQRIRSGLAWTIADVIADAQKYQSRAAWMRASSSAYRFAIRHGVSDIATRHMKYVVEHGKWTKTAILESARQFETASEWRKNRYSAYVTASRKGWKEEACAHMRVTKRPNGYWTAERLLAASERFSTVGEWRRKEPVSYSIAKRGKLVPATMTRELVHGQWTRSRIATVASRFKTRGQFRKGSPSAYTIASKKGWLGEVCAHMERAAPENAQRSVRR
jgi:very-short-patch-repair endonuclease